MKNLILLGLLVLSGQAMATKITMTDPQEEQTENGKTLCIYENSIYTFTYITKGACPYAKTFNAEDSEE
ncbi:TPA: hypothetical protein ACS624_000081 [Klebsiella michiganensis]|uniref:hypothetical protein n=1 Tax=Klebsiella michiganensis TaxID=1134687 RepID=UPI0007CCD69D|nr:hypothetical protein [Klebsiella michiganensis]MCB3570341.1 hypothetical protein [Klebsiella michiganensis]MCD6620559.1 hypothetical protein [Klebsiella michiganensis]MDU4155380.1 hypothetical protein [Klebsiella michiganensis]WBK51544.1 hypothetical protein OEE45_22600 [Klebsiella michiganensis]WBN07490.1 hypothetical protein KHV91_04400 [Klebsiella michiganensis]